MTISHSSFPQSSLSWDQLPRLYQDIWDDVPLTPLQPGYNVPSGEMEPLLPELPVPFSEVSRVDQVAKGSFEAQTPQESGEVIGHNMSGRVVEQIPVAPATVSHPPNQELILAGVAYQLGQQGCERNSKKAVDCFLQADGLEKLEQLSLLGVRYLKGRDCERAPSLALIIFFAGAEAGDPACTNWLKVCCKQGIGFPSLLQMPIPTQVAAPSIAPSTTETVLAQGYVKAVVNEQEIAKTPPHNGVSHIEALALRKTTPESSTPVLAGCERRESEIIRTPPKDDAFLQEAQRDASSGIEQRQVNPEGSSAEDCEESGLDKHQVESSFQVAAGCLEASSPPRPSSEAVSPSGTEVPQPDLLMAQGIVYQLALKGKKDSKKAVDCFLQANGLGRLDQLYQLGEVYLDGSSCEKDQTLALTIFSAGADLGDPACRDRYQRCIAQGVGMTAVPQTTLQSSLNVQTNDDSPQTIPVLSCTLSEGSGQRKKRKVEKIPSRASPASAAPILVIDDEVDVPLGALPLDEEEKEDSTDAAKVLLPERSNVTPPKEEQVEAVLNEIEQQTNPSPAIVASLIEKARAGDAVARAVARNDLGVWCFENEKGVRKIQHLLRLFASAAFKDIPAAQCNLGFCYRVYGKDCSRYRGFIRSWIDKAIKAGYKEAWNIRGITSLFDYSSDGKLIKKSWVHYRKEAEESFKTGADLGDRCCMFNLASCYQFGIGVKRNLATAEEKRREAEKLPPSTERDHLIKEIFYQFTQEDAVSLPPKKPKKKAKAPVAKSKLQTPKTWKWTQERV